MTVQLTSVSYITLSLFDDHYLHLYPTADGATDAAVDVYILLLSLSVASKS